MEAADFGGNITLAARRDFTPSGVYFICRHGVCRAWRHSSDAEAKLSKINRRRRAFYVREKISSVDGAWEMKPFKFNDYDQAGGNSA